VGDVADDARVRELGEDARLALEALERGATSSEKDLERYVRAALEVARSEDDAHAPGAGLGVDAEAAADDVPRAHGARGYARAAAASPSSGD
jgi:hypothetical protein